MRLSYPYCGSVYHTTGREKGSNKEVRMGEIELVEPHLPEDFRLVLQQMQLMLEIYHELIMVWAQPAYIHREKPEDRKS